MSNTSRELLEELISRLGQTNTSDGKAAEAAKLQADAAYQEKALSARQAYDSADAALLEELEQIRQSTDRARAGSAESYARALSEQDRSLLKRGMQRSSYAADTLSGIRQEGAAADAALLADGAAAERSRQAERTRLAGALTETLAGYAKTRDADEAAALSKISENERAARAEETALLEKLYSYRHQLETEENEQARWLAEFYQKYGLWETASRGTNKGKSGLNQAGAAIAAGVSGGMETLLEQLRGMA